ncbi:MAG: hypothetical protein JXB47_06775 [Anaerolineae bacterium]|nr:hypothetical protein [Anaerolineae bacterium]
MTKRIRIVLLCEDRQQEVFARRFLYRCGVEPARIRARTAIKGKGSAEQFVREQYPAEVKAYRSKPYQKDIGLVVIIDADVKAVEERCQEFETALAECGLSGRQTGERIGIFVPKRSIETWICYLRGETVNETDKYPHLQNESDCRSVIEALADNRHNSLPVDAPPSLCAACKELDRLFL